MRSMINIMTRFDVIITFAEQCKLQHTRDVSVDQSGGGENVPKSENLTPQSRLKGQLFAAKSLRQLTGWFRRDNEPRYRLLTNPHSKRPLSSSISPL